VTDPGPDPRPVAEQLADLRATVGELQALAQQFGELQALAQQAADTATQAAATAGQAAGDAAAAKMRAADAEARNLSFGALAAQFAELRDFVTNEEMKLLTRIKQVATDLDEAIAAHRVKPPHAPYWADLAAGERRARVQALAGWVNGFLRAHYPGYEIGECWANHSEAIWELSNLWTEWTRVYGDKDNRSLEGALTWHEKWFPGVVSRLAAAMNGCSPGRCRRAPQPQAAPRTGTR
jgi:hypothetical protein